MGLGGDLGWDLTRFLAPQLNFIHDETPKRGHKMKNCRVTGVTGKKKHCFTMTTYDERKGSKNAL